MSEPMNSNNPRRTPDFPVPADRAVVDYYRRVAPFMMAHLAGRAVQLHRDAGAGHGAWRPGRGQAEPSSAVAGSDRLRPLLASATAVAWHAEQGAVIFEAGLCRRAAPARPDRLIFDLIAIRDEAPRSLAAVAQALRDALEAVDLDGFPLALCAQKLRIVVPLAGDASADQARAFAAVIAGRVAGAEPAARAGQGRPRVALDVGGNVAHGSAVVAYSLLGAASGGPVAVPLAWDELSRRLARARHFAIADVLRRLDRHGCPWPDFDRHRQSLARAIRRLGEMRCAMH